MKRDLMLSSGAVPGSLFHAGITDMTLTIRSDIVYKEFGSFEERILHEFSVSHEKPLSHTTKTRKKKKKKKKH